MTKITDLFDPNEVFGGDNEDLIDEQEEEESKEEEDPFQHNAIEDDCIFELANENISEDDLELVASKELMNEMVAKMHQTERSNIGTRGRDKMIQYNSKKPKSYRLSNIEDLTNNL